MSRGRRHHVTASFVVLYGDRMAAPLAEIVAASVRRAFAGSRAAVEGLSDEEFFWEPVPVCWSIRRRAEPSVVGWGSGDWVCEGTWPPPEPPPVTTLGWRLAHLCAWTDIYRSHAFEDRSLALAALSPPASAAQGAAWLYRSQQQFLAHVESLTDADLDEERPIHWGRLFPLATLIRVIDVEHVHHGAEISLLRDLHRGTARAVPWSP
jgi:hypothetical protein